MLLNKWHTFKVLGMAYRDDMQNNKEADDDDFSQKAEILSNFFSSIKNKRGHKTALTAKQEVLLRLR